MECDASILLAYSSVHMVRPQIQTLPADLSAGRELSCLFRLASSRTPKRQKAREIPLLQIHHRRRQQNQYDLIAIFAFDRVGDSQ